MPSQRTQVQMPNGLLTIGSLAEFVREYVPIEIVNTTSLHVPVLNGSPIQNKIVHLNSFYEITHREIYRKQSNITANAELREQWMKYVIQSGMKDIEQYLLNKEEAFYVPKLGIDALQKLTLVFMNNGGGDAFGFYHSFSRYQQYFVIASQEAFKNFTTKLSPIADKAAYKGYCKLTEIQPLRWIMGRADDPFYWQKEMGSKMVYQSGLTESKSNRESENE